MNRKMYAVYGASGFGREIMPLARAQLLRSGLQQEQLVFVDDHSTEKSINGHRVLKYAEFLASTDDEKTVALAIANSEVRQRLYERCRSDGLVSWSICSDHIVVMDDAEIDEGALLCPFVTLTSNIRIGKHFHANIYSYVAHDCVIGDFVTFAPGVKCNGNVLIEDHAYIGAGAVLRQGKPGQPLTIGRGAVVGMGAVVTKDVPPGVTVVGNPARIFKR